MSRPTVPRSSPVKFAYDRIALIETSLKATCSWRSWIVQQEHVF